MDNSSMRYYFDSSALLKTTELMTFKQQRLPPEPRREQFTQDYQQVKVTVLLEFKPRVAEPEMGIESVNEIVKTYPQHLYISQMTTLECYDVFRQAYRAKKLGTAADMMKLNFRKIIERFQLDIQQFHILDLDELILGFAHKILLDHAGEYKIGSNDAIHLAFVLAQQPQMTMVTFDRAMKNVCNNLSIPVCFPVE